MGDLSHIFNNYVCVIYPTYLTIIKDLNYYWSILNKDYKERKKNIQFQLFDIIS